MRHPNTILIHVEELLLIVAFIIAVALFVISVRHKLVRSASTYLWDYQDPEACQRTV
jgi:hypothetical protein